MSDHGRLEERLREQEETLTELRELLDTTPDALVVVDEEGEIVLVNRQAEQLFGYRREDLLGDAVERLLPERFRDAHHKHRRHFATGPHRRPMGAGLDLFALTREGRELPVEISLSPIRLGERTLFASAIRDVTSRVEIEGRLREAREAADRATHAKARFIAAASHDLRQPLQAASIYLGLATNETLPEEQRRESLAKTQRCVDTMTGLLNKIMHVSRLDAGAVTIHRNDFAVAAVFQRIEDQQAPAAAEKGLALRVARCTQIARTDPVLLQQLVENLVSNAIRYTERGGVLLGCRPRGESLALQVWDSGMGIAEQDRESVFEEFHRLGGHSVDANLGMGLGLAIVRRLERLLGLSVTLRSEVGRGTMFEVLVPRGQGRPEPMPEAKGRRVETPSHGLVALVDDDLEVLEAIRTVLEVEGHVVVAATSLAEIEQRLDERRCSPDVLLTDYRLSAMTNGLEVIDALRQSYGPSLPAIVLTGDSSFSLLEEQASERRFELLAKPVETARLLRVLARSIGGAEDA